MPLKKKNPGKQTTQESIPYLNVYKNGVIETKTGTFTKTYKLQEVNFNLASDEEQIRMYQTFQKLLNSFDAETRFQLLISNNYSEKTDTLERLRFAPQKDGKNSLRQELNAIIAKSVLSGNNGLEQNKYFTVSIDDASTDHAMERFKGIDKEIDKIVREIDKDTETVPLTLAQRLKVIHDIYNQEGESVFENDVNEKGEKVFKFEQIYKSGMTTKDVVSPGGLEFKGGFFKTGDSYGCSLFLERVPTYLSTEFLSNLTNIPTRMLVSINYKPVDTAKAMKMIKDQLTNINAQIAGEQKKAAEAGYASGILPPDLERSREQTMDLMNDVVGRDQKMFFVTFVVTVFAGSKNELDEKVKNVRTIANKYLCPLKPLLYQQEKGLNASLPLAVNDLSVSRIYTTESAAIYMPYTSQELYQPGGMYYGLNEETRNVIMYSRMSGRNFNGLIFGESGSGKSFTAKCEMLSVLLRSDKNRVYVIDPQSEYTPMARALDGEVIEISTGSNRFINPMDMDIDYGGDGNPVSMKSDYILSMIEIMLGDGQYLDARARSIVDRCVKNVYRGYINHMDELKKDGVEITCDKDATPTLNALYRELLEQPEPEARSIANVLEIYATGSLSTFAHRTNVDTDSNYVVYDIKNLGTGMTSLGLHICLNDIWNKCIENRRKGLWTWIYIDEFYLLLQSDGAAKFLTKIWKLARKWNGVPTGIMQNTEDLLRSADSRNIINNTSFMMIMSLAKIDRMNLADLLQIPEKQMEYITNAEPGHGIIYAGKSILPFDNEYPTDSRLYKIMSTSSDKDKARGEGLL